MAPLLELYLQCHVSVVSEKKERLQRFVFTAPCFCGAVELYLQCHVSALSEKRERRPRFVFKVPCFCGAVEFTVSVSSLAPLLSGGEGKTSKNCIYSAIFLWLHCWNCIYNAMFLWCQRRRKDFLDFYLQCHASVVLWNSH